MSDEKNKRPTEQRLNEIRFALAYAGADVVPPLSSYAAALVRDTLAEVDELQAEIGRANERAVMWLQAATEASALLAHPSVAKHAAAVAGKR